MFIKRNLKLVLNSAFEILIPLFVLQIGVDGTIGLSPKIYHKKRTVTQWENVFSARAYVWSHSDRDFSSLTPDLFINAPQASILL